MPGIAIGLFALATAAMQAAPLPEPTPARCREAGELYQDAIDFQREFPPIDLAKLPEDARADVKRRQDELRAMVAAMEPVAAALAARFAVRPLAERRGERPTLDLDDAALAAFARACLAMPR
jgi:hypothetical protein